MLRTNDADRDRIETGRAKGDGDVNHWPNLPWRLAARAASDNEVRKEATDMIEMITKTPEALGEAAVNALKANRFDASYLATGHEAVRQLLAMIPEDAVVGIGGSKTIETLGLAELLKDRGNTVLWHNEPGLTPEQSASYRHGQLSCDVFLASANAITLKGEIVNRDGVGNRVAAMIFGPQKVILVAGINKIVDNLEAAELRIRTVAAPLNNKRLNRPNPCVKTGVCMDCSSPTRICNVTTILSKRPSLTEMSVLLVGEELGF